MDIYDRIELLLKRRRINKTQLCARTGVSYNTLSSLFKRRSKNIDLDTVRKIAPCLGTTIEYLVTGNERFIDCEKDGELINNTVVAFTSTGERREYQLTESEMTAILTLLQSMRK